MKENKDANNSNTNNSNTTKRNSDIISIERTNNMNNIDLNTITIEEAKAAGIAGMDLLKVLRNPVNSVVTKKNEEFAADLKAKTEKKKPTRKYNFTESSAKSLGWKRVEAGYEISNAARLFEGLIDLFDNNDFTTWMDRSDYKDALLIVSKEIFGEKVSDEDLIKRAHLNVLNLNWGITYINEGNESVLRGTLYNAYRNPFLAAAEIGLISEEDCNRYDEYMLRIK